MLNTYLKYTSKLIGSLIYLIPVISYSQSAYQDIRNGNQSYKENDYPAAEELYRESIRKDGSINESAFNLGDALYRQGKYEDAARYFDMAANRTEDKNARAEAYHNLGNSLLKSKKLEEAINAYKRALINNPQDEDSRYNLAYAMQQQKQEQQQQEEKKEEDKKENQEEQNQDQQNQDQQEQEEEKEQEQEEQQKQEEQEQKEEEQKKEQQQQEQQVSREDAERILEALNNEEKKLQEKLKKKKVKEVDVNIEKDW